MTPTIMYTVGSNMLRVREKGHHALHLNPLPLGNKSERHEKILASAMHPFRGEA